MSSWYEKGLGVMDAGGSAGGGATPAHMVIMGGSPLARAEAPIKALTAALSTYLKSRNYIKLGQEHTKAAPLVRAGKPALVRTATWSAFVLVFSAAQAAIAAAPPVAFVPQVPSAPRKTEAELEVERTTREAQADVQQLENRIRSLAAVMGSYQRSGNHAALATKVAEAEAELLAGQRTVTMAVWNALNTTYAAALVALQADSNQTDPNQGNDIDTSCAAQGGTWFVGSGCVLPGDPQPGLPTDADSVPGMSLTTKLLIGGGVVAVAGVGYYLLKGGGQGRNRNSKLGVNMFRVGNVLYSTKPAEGMHRFDYIVTRVDRSPHKSYPEKVWAFNQSDFEELLDYWNRDRRWWHESA
jgi:hypothetical protein